MKEILKRYFPDSTIKNIVITERPNGEKTMRCTVGGLIIYMSGLPPLCRQEIYGLINKLTDQHNNIYN